MKNTKKKRGRKPKAVEAAPQPQARQVPARFGMKVRVVGPDIYGSGFYIGAMGIVSYLLQDVDEPTITVAFAVDGLLITSHEFPPSSLSPIEEVGDGH